MKKAAIVIPFYRNEITDYEQISLKQCERVLVNHDKIAIKPIDLVLPEETKSVSFCKTISFSNTYFESISGYNSLMLSAEFYKAFLEYEYILIYQMDCFVFSDQLNFWCDQNWDYIGAPWIQKTYHKNLTELYFLRIKKNIKSFLDRSDHNEPNQYQLDNQVGNGGFSLRRVHKFHNLCLLMEPVINLYLSSHSNLHNEDVFWSIEINREKRVLNIPSLDTALKFAVEVPPIKLKNLNAKNLPFGCHDWDRYADYWQKIFKELGYQI